MRVRGPAGRRGHPAPKRRIQFGKNVRSSCAVSPGIRNTILFGRADSSFGTSPGLSGVKWPFPIPASVPLDAGSMFPAPQVRQAVLTRSVKWKPRNIRNTLKRLSASRPGATPNPPRLLAVIEPRLSCGSCISWFLYFAVRGRNALATLPVLTLLRRSCRAAAGNVELADA